MFVAESLERWLGQVVGNGHCVRLCQIAVPRLPHTSRWRRGDRVREADVPPGTIIATFDAGATYGNHSDGSSHAAIYLGQNADGLQVIDQWVGHRCSERTLRFHGGKGWAADDGDRFYVVIATARG